MLVLFINKTKQFVRDSFSNNELIRITVFGFYIHILLIFAVFSLYFSSPVEEGMAPVKSTNNPPAKRLVLFVADGLYANAIYRGRSKNAPFLTGVCNTRGSWGYSHTRVPTESRPGHVALLAGMFEDPSAIFKGWQANPVDFDSVINQSSSAWCWGSPEIVGIFNKDNSSHIHTYSYGSEMEDFGNKNTTALDAWVFEKFEAFLKNKWTNKNQSGVIFFLHLLGIDTAGHGFKPFSAAYTDNIKFVDKYVGKIETIMNQVVDDNRTAYILTSDHGMTDWGSHGGGSPRETETPIIAWGAGIAKKHRQDIHQVDIAPLISALLGINFPINSIGKLPYNYLDLNLTEKYNILVKNAAQLMETYTVKECRIKESTILYFPFRAFDEKTQQMVDFAANPETVKSFEFMFERIEETMEIVIEGIDYYHYYYQKPILFAITIGLFGWLLYLGIEYLCPDFKHAHRKQYISYIFCILFLVTIVLVYVQKMPISYYFYFTFPLVTWHNVFSRSFLIYDKQRFLNTISNRKFQILSTFFIGGIIFYALGFYKKELYCTAPVFCTGWYIVENLDMNKFKISLLATFSITVFFFIPIMSSVFNVILFLIQVLILIIRLRFLNDSLKTNPLYSTFTDKILNLQLWFMALAAFYSCLVRSNWVPSDSGLAYRSMFLSVCPILLIPCSTNVLLARILTIIEGFLPFYILMSSHWELLFIFLYIEILLFWLKAELSLPDWNCYHEFKIVKIKFGQSVPYCDIMNEKITFRNGFFFMSMIFVGFFGTGNIASFNSFDPMYTRCFLTVFSPFTMTALIILKVCVPFIYCCVILRAINSYCNRPLLDFFRVMLIMSDIMMLYFLYNVTNIGSWLDIGMSLSHFIIMDTFVIVILLLYGVSYLLTSL